MPADPSIVVSGHVSDLPFHPPATNDKRDAELAFDRLDKKIVGSVTRVTTLETGLTAANSNIATNTTNIASNTTNVASNTTNIATNATNIATNASGVTTNATNATNLTNSVSTINTSLGTKVDEDGTISDVTLPYPNYLSGDFAGSDNYNQMSIANWNNGSFSQELYWKLAAVHANILALQTKVNQIAVAMRG